MCAMTEREKEMFQRKKGRSWKEDTNGPQFLPLVFVGIKTNDTNKPAKHNYTHKLTECDFEQSKSAKSFL